MWSGKCNLIPPSLVEKQVRSQVLRSCRTSCGSKVEPAPVHIPHCLWNWNAWREVKTVTASKQWECNLNVHHTCFSSSQYKCLNALKVNSAFNLGFGWSYWKCTPDEDGSRMSKQGDGRGGHFHPVGPWRAKIPPIASRHTIATRCLWWGDIIDSALWVMRYSGLSCGETLMSLVMGWSMGMQGKKGWKKPDPWGALCCSDSGRRLIWSHTLHANCLRDRQYNLVAQHSAE